MATDRLLERVLASARDLRDRALRFEHARSAELAQVEPHFRESARNPPRILMASLRSPPVGVMVARGDLAVEVGFERLSEVQEEILWLCEAAHVPVIWATQVLHGDEFDGIVRVSPFLESLGSSAYSFALRLNRHVNSLRSRLGYPYWSLAAFLKHKVKNAVQYIGNYERAVSTEAARRNVDGVICGHIHRAEIATLGEVTYCNDGDWVESCTALVEDFSGELSLLRWTESPAFLVGDREFPVLDRPVHGPEQDVAVA
jgi:hypothetical protein